MNTFFAIQIFCLLDLLHGPCSTKWNFNLSFYKKNLVHHVKLQIIELTMGFRLTISKFYVIWNFTDINFKSSGSGNLESLKRMSRSGRDASGHAKNLHIHIKIFLIWKLYFRQTTMFAFFKKSERNFLLFLEKHNVYRKHVKVPSHIWPTVKHSQTWSFTNVQLILGVPLIEYKDKMSKVTLLLILNEFVTNFLILFGCGDVCWRSCSSGSERKHTECWSA